MAEKPPDTTYYYPEKEKSVCPAAMPRKSEGKATEFYFIVKSLFLQKKNKTCYFIPSYTLRKKSLTDTRQFFFIWFQVYFVYSSMFAFLHFFFMREKFLIIILLSCHSQPHRIICNKINKRNIILWLYVIIIFM
jgi:hypothetical protein